MLAAIGHEMSGVIAAVAEGVTGGFGQVHHQPAGPIEEVDTFGADDAFFAGYLAKLMMRIALGAIASGG